MWLKTVALGGFDGVIIAVFAEKHRLLTKWLKKA